MGNIDNGTIDYIAPEQEMSLAELFRERVKRTPDAVAYHYFQDNSLQLQSITWQQMAERIARWQHALENESLNKGDRVALMIANGIDWVTFEQAALGLGLVVVPLYTNDRAENVSFILQDADVRILLIGNNEQWQQLTPIHPQLDGLNRILALRPCKGSEHRPRFSLVDDWLPTEENNCSLIKKDSKSNELATLVYTSGTTGLPKGVMLSHKNILCNTFSGIQCTTIIREDIFLSFLPCSHMLERMAGYYIPMMTGASIAYARSVQQLAEDLIIVKPTVLISVPRIYERVFAKMQTQLQEKSPIAKKLFNVAVNIGWSRFQLTQNRGTFKLSHLLWPILNKLVAEKVMKKLGGRLRIAICGGAPLNKDIAKTFIGLGLSLRQGYGLTESSPVISVNTSDNNDPASVGPPLPDVEVKLGEGDELFTRSNGVMLGYWHNQKATDEVLDKDGWLHTGDIARIEQGRIYITGRIKDIIVLSNGEKVPPADMEMAIAMDPLFEQVIIIGEGRPFLTSIIVLEPEQWRYVAIRHNIDPDDHSKLNSKVIRQDIMERINKQISHFPGYAQVRRIHITLKPWDIDNGLLTPSLKIKRKPILEEFKAEIKQMYAGH